MTPSAGVAVVGATATGKTELAAALARRLDAEIVCCDSRQVYAPLEIGTGKPTTAERAAWPHHLFDALALDQPASAGWFGRAAAAACAAIRERGRTVLLVGGSGLYLRALLRGLAPTPSHDPAVRARLREELEARGAEALHARLAAVDPVSAARLHPRDRQRVSRALEVQVSTGRPLSWWHAQETAAPAGAWRVLELVVAPAELRERIGRRSAWMLAHGLIEETRALLGSGLGSALRRLRAIGYDEAIAVIEGRLDRAAAETQLSLRTAQLAKRQRTWFRHQVEAIRLDAGGRDPGALERAALAALAADASSGTPD